METVKELRQKDYTVAVSHLRFSKVGDKPLLLPKWAIKSNGLPTLSKGGITRVTVISPEGKIGKGEAACSFEDMYCYQKGRELALERAMNQILAVDSKEVQPH